MLRAFPASPMRTAGRATTCCRPRSTCAVRPSSWPSSVGACRRAARSRSTTSSRSGTRMHGASTRPPLRALRPRQGHAAPLQLHVRSGRCRAPARRSPARAAPRSSTRSTARHHTSSSRSTSRWPRRRRSSSSAPTQMHAAGAMRACSRRRRRPTTATITPRPPTAASFRWPRSSRDAMVRSVISGAASCSDAPTDEGQHPRHVDFMWPLWAMLDRTPDGRGGDWSPRLDYS